MRYLLGLERRARSERPPDSRSVYAYDGRSESLVGSQIVHADVREREMRPTPVYGSQGRLKLVQVSPPRFSSVGGRRRGGFLRYLKLKTGLGSS